MLTGEQIELRKRGIGGSDLGVIVGESHRMTARELFHIKRGELDPSKVEDRTSMLGHAMEPALAQIYEEETGRKVQNTRATRFHRDLGEWALAHADRLVVGRERGLEIKMRQSTQGWGYSGTDDVAIDVRLQCQWYMEIYRRPLWDVIVLFHGVDYRIYTVRRDQRLIDTCIELAGEFVERMRDGIPPDVDFEHRTAYDLVRRLHPRSDGAQIENIPADIEHWHHVRMDAKKQRDEYDEVYKKASAHILGWMGDAACAYFPDGGVLRRNIVERQDGVSYPQLAYKPARRQRSR